MAVYTEVPISALEQFVREYDIGKIVHLEGIEEGVENSNFLLKTNRDTYILTIYEKRVDSMDLPFFLGLMDHLANKGFPCPTPLHGFDGKALRTLCNKPAALITFVTGSGPKIITRDHCYSVGKIAGKIHTAAKDFKMSRNNTLDRLGWRKLFELTKEHANDFYEGIVEEIEDELNFLDQNWFCPFVRIFVLNRHMSRFRRHAERIFGMRPRQAVSSLVAAYRQAADRQ